MAEIILSQVDECCEDLMKYFCSIFLRQRAIAVDPFKKLAIFAIFHENVYFCVSFDHLVHLNDILVEDVSLEIYFLLKGSKLLAIIA